MVKPLVSWHFLWKKNHQNWDSFCMKYFKLPERAQHVLNWEKSRFTLFYGTISKEKLTVQLGWCIRIEFKHEVPLVTCFKNFHFLTVLAQFKVKTRQIMIFIQILISTSPTGMGWGGVGCVKTSIYMTLQCSVSATLSLYNVLLNCKRTENSVYELTALMSTTTTWHGVLFN